MKIPKFTFKLPEPQIPHEVPEEFKEYMKRQITICDVDPEPQSMSFREFIEAWGKNRKRGNTTPENVYPKPKEKGWLEKFCDEYLIDELND